MEVMSDHLRRGGFFVDNINKKVRRRSYINLKMIAIVVVLLCIITGCGNSTENESVSAPENAQNSSGSKMESKKVESLEVSYKKVDIVKSLKN